MKKTVFVLLACLGYLSTLGQEGGGFPYGSVTMSEIEMTRYDRDTAAAAVVLDEFGEAYITDRDNSARLIFVYHVRIKIFRKEALSRANIEVPLWIDKGYEEKIEQVRASSYSMENGLLTEHKLRSKDVFLEKLNDRVNVAKFAVPGVREGSVIEYTYTIESPFFYNFRSWTFQWDIPKVRSEYWALIPGNWRYNISLRGFLNLSRNDNTIVRDCYGRGPNTADCARYKWAMENVPAFIEEEYMTARSNFISAISFELSQVTFFDGRVDKVTKEWKDAELELQRHTEFGAQLRRGKDIIQNHPSLLSHADPVERAKAIYQFCQEWFQWNGKNGLLTDLGVKKAYETRQGNVPDINLSMIAAMREANLDVEPVILSTRNNGVPVDIYPVLSDFNYVVAKVNIEGKSFLADATDPLLPFGMLPHRCLNGKGRVLGKKESYWTDLAPADRAKQVSVLDLTLEETGKITGTIHTTYSGYDALAMRKHLFSFRSADDFIKDMNNNLHGARITEYELRDADDIYKPLKIILTVELNAFDEAAQDVFLFNPPIPRKWSSNPFKSNERLYPVDFGMGQEATTVFSLRLPEGVEVSNESTQAALSIPDGSGRYYFDLRNDGDRISVSSSIILGRGIYTATEYHYLKELFAAMIQKQNEVLVFRKKT